MKFPYRKIVGTGIIVLMLVGSFAPMRLTHAHESPVAGLEPHTHGAGHTHDGHVHHEQNRMPMESVSAFGRHSHVYLLGFEVLLSEMPSGGNDQPTAPGDDESMARLAPVSSNEAVLLGSAVVPASVSEMTVVRCAPLFLQAKATICRATARFSPPLCDTARHERTGVLVL